MVSGQFSANSPPVPVNVVNKVFSDSEHTPFEISYILDTTILDN